MHIFRQEFAHSYNAYAFAYTILGRLEEDEESRNAYEGGFLPKSDDPAVHDLFYMARSTRVPLADFNPTSENRRVLKKYDGEFECETLDRGALSHDPEFRSSFLSYFSDRHGQGVMTEERLEGILQTKLPVRGRRYSHDGKSAAYVLEVEGEAFGHYWYSCYSSDYADSSLGMWLMLDAVRRAKSEGSDYFYLGTAYGEKGRYKMNVCPLEFWSGIEWKNDAKELKALIGSDSSREFPA